MLRSRPGTGRRFRGATAFKFGIYFGRVKSDSQEKYQFTAKIWQERHSRVCGGEGGVTELVPEGAQNKHDFEAIDGNPLSSMFKAKILSLYFPDRFLPVCNPDHLDLLARKVSTICIEAKFRTALDGKLP